MPRHDATGPLGEGPGTGRGLGPCGKGRSRGFRRRFWRDEEPRHSHEVIEEFSERLDKIEEMLEKLTEK